MPAITTTPCLQIVHLFIARWTATSNLLSSRALFDQKRSGKRPRSPNGFDDYEIAAPRELENRTNPSHVG
jgi:hypothetical protein